MASVLKDWVQNLGLRFQGVLVSAIRGCDVAERHDKSKVLQRVYRSEILNTHCGDPAKSKSFILAATIPETRKMMNAFLEDCDHYPIHYVMHLVHAGQILGYYLPDDERRDLWLSFYAQSCKKFHLEQESKSRLFERLEEDEEKFHREQEVKVEARTYDTSRYGGS